MNNFDKIAEVLYQLAKKTDGKSEKLLSFFGLDSDTYENVFPTTFLQRQIYLDLQKQGDSKAFSLGQYIVHRPPFDIDRWKEAIGYLMKDHPIYRTRFVLAKTFLYQAVLKTDEPQFNIYDRSEYEPGHDSVTSLIESIIRSPFDMFGNQLIRHFVIKCAGEQCVLGIAFNQLITDGISGRNFYDHCLEIYKGLGEGLLVSTAVDKRFQDYVFENNEQVDTAAIQSFWKRKLKGTSLPSRLMKKQGSSQTQTQELVIDPGLSSKIKQLCWNLKITPSLFFKIVYSYLLKVHLHQDSTFMFFENRHGRTQDYMGVHGGFMNTDLVVIEESVFHDTSSLNTWIQYFRDFRKETRANQLISFGAALNIVDNIGLKCFYNYIEHPQLSDSFDQAVFLYRFEGEAPSDEVHFLIEENEDSMLVRMFYHPNSFDYLWFLDRYEFILKQLLKNPEIPANAIELVLTERRDASFISGASVSVDDLFVTLFENQVRQVPDNHVVGFEEQHYSYEQINRLANQLGHHLIEVKKLVPGDIVAVYMERSHQYLMVLLALMKSRLVYLPIDPNYPESRRNYILDDAAPKLIITESQLDLVFEFPPILNINDLVWESENIHNPGLEYQMNDVAYLLYTSGSTGRPKGAKITQKGMVNHLMSKVGLMILSAESVVFQNASQGFDISIWQFLSALIPGGKTLVCAEHSVLDPEKLLAILEQEKVSILELVPSYLQVLLKQYTSKLHVLASLEYLLLTGEELIPSGVKKWFELFPDIPIINAYGPTEAADDVTHHVMTQFENPIALGTPIPNTQISLLDQNGKLVPRGFLGEIVVGGFGVGKGYHNRPNETEAAFIRDPDNPLQVQYWTGDLGRIDDTGKLFYFGRKDHQVKINGFRIELSEIEHLISDMDGVKECIVQKRDEPEGLVAFIIGNNVPDSSMIQNHLSQFVPKVMIPVAIKVMKEWPLTPNGKIDRKTLAEIEMTLLSKNHVEASSETEKEILNIWSNVLSLEKISTQDSFFALGGHSLNGIQVIHQIKESFHPDVSLKMLFENPTIETLAQALDKLRSKDKSDQDVTDEKEQFII